MPDDKPILDYVATDDLLRELMSRHSTIILCGIRSDGDTLYTVRNGSAVVMLGLLQILRDDIRTSVKANLKRG
jgi:hypothetical protein